MGTARSFFLLCLTLCVTPALATTPKRDPMREAQDAIRQRVIEGFDTEAEIVDGVSDLMGDELSKAQLAKLPAAVKQALAAQKREEQTWKAPTDVDRLEAAFAALDALGVFARIKFSDCQTCAISEMATELEKPANARFRGYVYCHEQDVEGAADPRGGVLRLGYGPRPGGAEKDTIVIANEVVAMLKRAKLEVMWDGSLDRRIAVKLKWQKRRFSKSPPVALAP